MDRHILTHIKSVLELHNPKLQMNILLPNVPSILDVQEACIAGWTAAYMGKHRHTRIDHRDMAGFRAFATNTAMEAVGHDQRMWSFIFGSKWSNDVQAAIKRIQFVLDTGEAPAYFDAANRKWVAVTTSQVFDHPLSPHENMGTGFGLVDLSNDGIVHVTDLSSNTAHIVKMLVGRTTATKEGSFYILNKLKRYRLIEG